MLGKHAAIYFAGRVIPGLVSVVTIGVFTRVLSPGDYGTYALIVSAVGVLNVLLFQWLGLGAARYFATHAENPAPVVATAMRGFLAIGVVALLIGLASGMLVNDAVLSFLIFWTAVLGLAQGWFDLSLRIAAARLNPIGHGVATSVKALVALGSGLALFNMGMGLNGVLMALAVALAGSTVIVNRGKLSEFSRKLDFTMLGAFFRYGVPLSVTSLLIISTDMSGRLFIGYFMDAKAVGMYAPSFDLAQQTLGMLMGVISLASFPLVVNALERDGIDAAKERLLAHGRILISISVPATCGLVVLARDVAAVVVGPAFREMGGQIIPVIAIATFLSGLRSGYFDYAFQLSKRTASQVWVVGAAAALNAVLNVIWIPAYGVIGAAYATLAALGFSLLMSMVIGWKIFALPRLHYETWAVIFVSLVMSAVLFGLDGWNGTLALVGKMIIGLAVYSAGCAVFNINDFRRHLLNIQLLR